MSADEMTKEFSEFLLKIQQKLTDPTDVLKIELSLKNVETFWLQKSANFDQSRKLWKTLYFEAINETVKILSQNSQFSLIISLFDLVRFSFHLQKTMKIR